MSLLFCGFLIAVGLTLFVLVFLACALTSILLLLIVALFPRAQQRFVPSITEWRSRGGHSTHEVLKPIWQTVYSSSLSAFALVRRRVPDLAEKASHASLRLSRRLAQATRTGVMRFAPRPVAIELRREALRLNEAGCDHRRNGLYDEAVECHRQALEILRTVDDRRAIALTENNLALALSRAGDDRWAIGLFEEAAAMLHELGDEEYEAQIMANLGLAHRRHGRHEEGDTLLQLALTKLSPSSSVYQTIESELLRAS